MFPSFDVALILKTKKNMKTLFIIYCFVCLLSPLLVHSRKVAKQCEYEYYLDEPCNTAAAAGNKCLPNAILLSVGIDITDMSYKSDVLGLKWGTSTYTNPYDGQPYVTPDKVTVVPLDQSNEITGTILIQNVSQSEKWQSELVVDKSEYIVGMSSHTIDTYKFIEAENTKSSQLGYVLYNYNIYEVIVPYDAQELDEQAARSIALLPEEYDKDQYILFISSYGTHFITSSKWGIKYKFISSYKQCILYTHSESYVYEQVETDGWIHSSEHTTYSGYSTTDSYYSSRSVTSQTFEGGNMSYHDSSRWDEWVASGYLMTNPVQTSLALKPIYTLIKNDPVRQANMKTAFEAYLSERKEKQAAYADEQKMKPKDVSYMSYQLDSNGNVKMIGAAPGGVITGMKPGTKSNVFGYGGDCHYLSSPYAYYYGSETSYYTNCLQEYYCERDAYTGQVRTKLFFDKWAGKTVDKNYAYDYDNNCGMTTVTTYDYERNQILQHNHWISRTGYYEGATEYYGYSSSSYTAARRVDMMKLGPYGHNWINYSTTFYDGPNSYYMSTTSETASSGCKSYGVCALDCDNLQVYKNPSGVIVQDCVC